MNLLIFNLAVDSQHVTLAFGLKWIEKLSKKFDHVDVITMTAGDYDLPQNVKVWSVGRERHYPKWLRVFRFYWLVLKVLFSRRIDVVFTHMIPIFAILFSPVACLARIRNVMWYAHGATPWDLRLAHYLVDRVVTSTPQGFRLRSEKVYFIGQGVDMTLYKPVTRYKKRVFHILTVGRLAPSKGLDLLISALEEWKTKVDWHLTIIGDASSESEKIYAGSLQQQVKQKIEVGKVSFMGRLDHKAIAPFLSKADVFVNLSSTGSLDKAMVEAMANGCPVISSNDAFREIATSFDFKDCAIEHSEDALRSQLNRLVNMSIESRNALGKSQAGIAWKDHELDGFIDRLFKILSKN